MVDTEEEQRAAVVFNIKINLTHSSTTKHTHTHILLLNETNTDSLCVSSLSYSYWSFLVVLTKTALEAETL